MLHHGDETWTVVAIVTEVSQSIRLLISCLKMFEFNELVIKRFKYL